MSRSTAGPYPRTPAAFTLIELMISIALVLVMMLGVNYVFSSVGQATGLTQAISRVTRDTQAAQSVMYRDFSAADMANAPFVVLRSFPTIAFRNREDYLAAVNQADPTADTDPVLGLYQHTAASMNNRVHRTDVLLFFARDKFSRQTGGGTFTPNSTMTPAESSSFIADMATQEAMIWYGHLRLPDDNGLFPSTGLPFARALTDPGAVPLGGNPNNFFANQWILGRMAVLLQEPTNSSTGEILTKRTARDANGALILGSFDETLHWSIKDNAGPGLHPLQSNSLSNSPTVVRLDSSRFDLAGTSMARMRGKTYAGVWWDTLMTRARFQAKPFILGAPGARLTPEALALQAPIFVANCSQFAVDYAGDFMSQDENGQIINNTTGDGIVDFHYNATPRTRTTRWYGFPRDTAGHYVGSVWNPPPDGRIRKDDGDVVPLRDHRGGQAPFERTVPLTAASPYEAALAVAPPLTPYVYVCAWEPSQEDRPQFFRITIAVDDPNGRFADPLTFEYVFKVP